MISLHVSGYLLLLKNMSHKKVLLRERKRHTARRVVTTHSVVLSWLTPPPLLVGLTPPPPRLDLTHPSTGWTDPPPAGWTDAPPRWLDLTHPPPPAGPDPSPAGPDPPPTGPDPPPPAGLRTDPPPPLWTDRRTDTCQNITFPSYYVRGR